MIKNFIKLVIQKMLFPVSLQVVEIYHSSESMSGIIDLSYTLYYVIVTLAICIIKICIEADLLTWGENEAEGKRNIKWLGHLMFFLGVMANLNAYAEANKNTPKDFHYWCGYLYIIALLVAFEILMHLIFLIKRK